MLVPGSNRRIAAVDRHAGMAGTGLAPDARQIVSRARSECAQYLSFYGDRIPAQILADRMAHYLHVHPVLVRPPLRRLHPDGCQGRRRLRPVPPRAER